MSLDHDTNAPEGTLSGMSEDEDFATLFAASQAEKKPAVRPGARVSGRIIGVGEESVFIDTGTKIDGVANKKEFLNDDGEFPYAEGDVLDLYVVEVSRDEIRLSKAFSGAGGIEVLTEAKENGVPVTGKITAAVKGGVSVEIMRKRAFCPAGQLDLTFVADPAALIGQDFPFLITKIEERGRNIVVSRRKLLEIERDKALAELAETVKVGDIVGAEVVRLAPFGAFVRIAAGVEGLVHVSELSWRRVADPAQAVSLGQSVTAKILSWDTDPKSGQPRISLSVKQAEGDPWDTAKERFKEGDTVEGEVTRLADFGAFIEIAPGLEGLAHVSELSHVRRVGKPSEVVSLGEKVSAVIKEIDPLKRRISLSLKAAAGDPFAEAVTSLAPGMEIEGVLEKAAAFGLFISLAPGVTGLLPKSKLGESPAGKSLERAKPGARVSVVIAEINPGERKITLAPAGAEAGSSGGDWKAYSGKNQPSSGTLGNLLQAALDKKKSR